MQIFGYRAAEAVIPDSQPRVLASLGVKKGVIFKESVTAIEATMVHINGK